VAELRLVLADPRTWLQQKNRNLAETPRAWWLRQHQLTVINNDGQKAVWPFTAVLKPPNESGLPDAAAVTQPAPTPPAPTVPARAPEVTRPPNH
jgi:hypothetical protein